MSIRGDILQALEDELLDIVDNPAGYPLDPVSVHHFTEPIQTLADELLPALFVIDTGDEELIAQDASHYFYRTTLRVAGAIKITEGGDLQSRGNALLATLKQFLDTEPNLGTGYRDLQQIGPGGIEYGPDSGIAIASIDIYILYVCAAGTF